MEEVTKTVGLIVLAIVIAIVIGLLMAFPVMWLWNWLMPVIFGLGKITVLQAFGLNMLSSALFKTSSSSK